MNSGFPVIDQSDHLSQNRSLYNHLQFNKWVFDHIQPYIRGRVLEIDSRSGLLSDLFLNNKIPIHLSDPDVNIQANLRKRFKENPNLKRVHNLDLNSPDFENLHSSLFSLIDSLILTNVLDHGFYNEQAIHNAKKLLPLRGRIAMIVPVNTAVYDQEDDEEFNMLLKYNSKSIANLLNPDLESIKMIYCKLNISLLIIARKI